MLGLREPTSGDALVFGRRPGDPAVRERVGAMLQEFDGAARLLGLDPGIWKILTHPKRQIVVSSGVPPSSANPQNRRNDSRSASASSSRAMRVR